MLLAHAADASDAPRISTHRVRISFLPAFSDRPFDRRFDPKIETRRIAALDRSRESRAKHFRSAARADEKKERERERGRRRGR